MGNVIVAVALIAISSVIGYVINRNEAIVEKRDILLENKACRRGAR